MQIVSLGHYCYPKWIIRDRKEYETATNVFDWINSFYFKNLIECVSNNFEDFTKTGLSPIDPLNTGIEHESNIIYNLKYNFRFPHEKENDCFDTEYDSFKDKYNRRILRFKSFATQDNNFLFTRYYQSGQYNMKKEILEEDYNNNNYYKLIKKLPKNSKILVISDEIISDEFKKNSKFYIIDNVILPHNAYYGDLLSFKDKIMLGYLNLFKYIENNFDNFDINKCKEFIDYNHLIKNL